MRYAASSRGCGKCQSGWTVWTVFMFFSYLARQCSPYANDVLRTNVKHALRLPIMGSMRSFQHQSWLFEGQLFTRLPQSRLQNAHQIRKMSQAAMTKPTQDPYRLPCNVKPVHYNLLIKTDLEALQFEGHVTIE